MGVAEISKTFFAVADFMEEAIIFRGVVAETMRLVNENVLELIGSGEDFIQLAERFNFGGDVEIDKNIFPLID